MVCLCWRSHVVAVVGMHPASPLLSMRRRIHAASLVVIWSAFAGVVTWLQWLDCTQHAIVSVLWNLRSSYLGGGVGCAGHGVKEQCDGGTCTCLRRRCCCPPSTCLCAGAVELQIPLETRFGLIDTVINIDRLLPYKRRPPQLGSSEEDDQPEALIIDPRSGTWWEVEDVMAHRHQRHGRRFFLWEAASAAEKLRTGSESGVDSRWGGTFVTPI